MLRKSVWEKEYLKEFWPKSSFLNEAEDKSKFVDNDKIYMAELGCDPEVMWNNSVFPIPTEEFTDGDVEISLQWATTKNTVIRDINKAARNQDLRQEYIKSHKDKMARSMMEKAAHMFALTTANTAKGNQIVFGSGAAYGGVKRATFEDFMKFREIWDEHDVDEEERNIVITSQHRNDLRSQDMKEYKELMKEVKSGGFSALLGAKVHFYSRNPYYNTTDNAKLAFGAVPTGTHQKASFGFVKSNSVKAFGTTKMFANLDDAYAEGDVFHFKQRFVATPKRDQWRPILLSKA